jgi:hypothetical protein
MHGKGKHKWPDGRCYDGQFVNGLMDGFGMFKGPNTKNKERLGEWREGKRVKWIDRTVFISYPD